MISGAIAWLYVCVCTRALSVLYDDIVRMMRRLPSRVAPHAKESVVKNV